MIRRLAEALLDEANIPPEIREMFFPKPPERSERPPPRPAQPAQRERGPAARRRQDDTVYGTEAASLELIERRPPPGDLETQRRTLGRPAPGRPIPKPTPSLLSGVTLRQAIVLREVLGPPKAMRAPDEDL